MRRLLVRGLFVRVPPEAYPPFIFQTWLVMITCDVKLVLTCVRSPLTYVRALNSEQVWTVFVHAAPIPFWLKLISVHLEKLLSHFKSRCKIRSTRI